MACQEASILSRQNASIMPRQTRIGKFTSRNHRDGVGTGRVAAGDVPRSPAPQPAAVPFIGRNPCVADRAAWWDGFSAACLYHCRVPHWAGMDIDLSQ